jgi:beta-N-acetylhexosaminidase
MVAAHGYPTNPKRVIIDTTFSNPRVVAQYIRDYKVGGVIFFQGGPVQQAQLTNYYQSISKVPLLVAMDSEWGLAMRLDSAVRFPYQMTMGAIQGNDELIYKMGKLLAAQKKTIGRTHQFCPVGRCQQQRQQSGHQFPFIWVRIHKRCLKSHTLT